MNPGGNFGGSPTLQSGQGMPGAPHWQARGCAESRHRLTSRSEVYARGTARAITYRHKPIVGISALKLSNKGRLGRAVDFDLAAEQLHRRGAIGHDGDCFSLGPPPELLGSPDH